MEFDKTGDSTATILDSIRGARDAVSVRRVFGDPQEVDGVTIIPVARVAGGGGGGGGEGPGEEAGGSGFGTGFGLYAQPVGIYVVRDGTLECKPTIDVTGLMKRCQVLAGIIVVCVTLAAFRRRA